MSYLKNKITEERDKLDGTDRFDIEISCSEELKTHPQDMGFLINMAKQEKIKHFEFFPDFLFQCIKRKTMSFKRYNEWKWLLKGGSF